MAEYAGPAATPLWERLTAAFWGQSEPTGMKGTGTPAAPEPTGVQVDPQGQVFYLKGDEGGWTDYLTKHIGTKTESPLVCPRCSGLMDYEHAEDVEVDVCLNCRGIWLDTGELAELQEVADVGFEGDKFYKAAEKLEADKSRTLLERFKRKMDL